MITHGFFGKLPTVGDFVGRGWHTSTRDGLDKLLQQAVAELLATSADGKQALTQAPCTVLSIRPRVIGDQGIVTVVMPSQDRVGRIFPLCAGVQWTDEGRGSMGWPALDYARELIARVHHCVDIDADADTLLAQIVALGSPRQFRQTFLGLGGDETLPRFGGEIKLLRMAGPQERMAPALVSLCAMLNEASDLLGVRLGPTGEAQDFFVCRRFESGAALASMFDGRWVERGWTSYDAPADRPPVNPTNAVDFDEDATQPGRKVVDSGAPAHDSPHSP